ncbi:unnamed protein product [Auanema sp. JU1783]|nr:unnamed protein product [Auanema sp. JU1783]
MGTRDRSPDKDNSQDPEPKKKAVMDIRTRAGGAYIPPAKLKLMQEKIADKGGEEYQRMNWERLKKKVHGLINKVNVGNLVPVVRELLQENVFRGQGLIVRSIMQAQAFSPVFSNIYAALVAVINSKFPNIGDLLLRRLIIQFKRSFVRNDKGTAVIVTKFIAHLVNQNVVNEVVALEIIFLMLHNPTDDSVEVAIALLKECGSRLLLVAKKALNIVFDRLRAILQDVSKEGSGLDKRVEYMIHAVMAIRKENFVAYPAVVDDLDLIDEKDQISHVKSIDDTMDAENMLNVFKFDTDFEKNEADYDEIRKNIIGDAEDSDEDDDDDDDDEEGGEGNQDAGESNTMEIIDKTELNLAAFRRRIYLTIQSSLDYQEACHKILKIGIEKEMETELCHMLVDCCTQERTYGRFFGLLCERFCRLKAEFQLAFEQIVRDTYATVHRFEITKLRNISKLFSHLLYTDAISWNVLSDIKMTEDDTTSSGRIYVKYIFQELVEHMGVIKLYERLKDPTMQSAFAGLFPRDNPQNTRFAINFFTLIGLGALTMDLRKFLEKGLKSSEKEKANDEDSSSSESSSDSSDSDSDSDSDSSSSSSSSSSGSSDSSSDSDSD